MSESCVTISSEIYLYLRMKLTKTHSVLQVGETFYPAGKPIKLRK